MVKALAKLVALLTPNRRWAQFSLATMFVVVTVFCVLLSVVVNRAHRQRDAVAAIEALGGKIEYVRTDQEVDEAFPRRLLRRWLSRDYFDDVYFVHFPKQAMDRDMSHLQALTAIQTLSIGATQITDAGLLQLRRLRRVQSLYLNGTRVTDDGLANLHGLTTLQCLYLTGTGVNDAGLPHLHGLTELRQIDLRSSDVTDDGVAQLRLTLPNCQILWP